MEVTASLVCQVAHTLRPPPLLLQHPKYGLFDCKPLALIWAKFPEQYGPHNTIMLDDLRRNYVLNKQQGLVIRPFKKVHWGQQWRRGAGAAVERSCSQGRPGGWARQLLPTAVLCFSFPPSLRPTTALQQAHLTRNTDRELLYLSAYLGKIASLESLEGLNHK